jgi:hypothetical protein
LSLLGAGPNRRVEYYEAVGFELDLEILPTEDEDAYVLSSRADSSEIACGLRASSFLRVPVGSFALHLLAALHVMS